MINWLKNWFSRLSIEAGVDWIERIIIICSGPAIAASGIIAGFDVLTGGSMARHAGWLTYVWAGSLLLTLDFQVLVLGKKGIGIWESTEKKVGQKIAEIALILIVASSISYVSIQMQSIMARMQEDGPQGTIAVAAQELGIDSNALIWERSTLVLFLIFLSGWTTKRSNADRRVAISEVPTVESIVAAVTPLLDQKVSSLSVTLKEDAIKTVTENITASVTKTVTASVTETKKVTDLVTQMTEQMMNQAVTDNGSDISLVTKPLENLAAAVAEIRRELSLLRVTVTEEVTQEMSQLVSQEVAQVSQQVSLIEQRVARSDSDEHPALTPDVIARMLEDALKNVVPTPLPEPVHARQQVSRVTTSKSVTVTKRIPKEEWDKELERAYRAIQAEGGRLSGRSVAERSGINRNYAAEWFGERAKADQGVIIEAVI